MLSSSLAVAKVFRFSVCKRFIMTTALSAKSKLGHKIEIDKTMMKTVGKKDEGVEGEKYFNVDPNIIAGSLPTYETLDEVYNGVRFRDLPICHIKASRNNTICNVTDSKGKSILLSTAGTEGFKNCKKGTNVAGQAVGVTVGYRAVKAGIPAVRVVVSGLGPGRMSSVKGLIMSGLTVVSITDFTPLPELGPRPRKARKL